MLLPRVLTALVGIPFLLYLIHLGSLPYLALVVGLAALALHEYATVLWLGGRGVQRVLTVAGGALTALAVALSGEPRAGAGLAHLTLTGVVLAAVLRELFRREHSLDRAALTVFGAMFVGWTLGHLALLRDLEPYGKELSLLLFVSIWTCDSFAYAAGKLAGRHKLARVVSPKKTWEGFAAGLAGATMAACLVRAFLAPAMLTPAQAAAAGLGIGVLGQVSDLAQSLVKRASGVKDSSELLPGHGGVFDRMDSFLLLAPVFYYAAVLAR